MASVALCKLIQQDAAGQLSNLRVATRHSSRCSFRIHGNCDLRELQKQEPTRTAKVRSLALQMTAQRQDRLNSHAAGNDAPHLAA